MKFITRLKKFALADEGQDLLEYALLVALIALVSVAVIGVAGTNVNTIFASIGTALVAGGVARARGSRTGSGAAAPLLVFRKARLMAQLMTAIGRLVSRTSGQDLIEYGLLAALIAMVAMVSVGALGNTIYNVFWENIGQAI